MIYHASFRARFWRSPFGLLLVATALIWLLSRPIVYNLGERLALTIARPFWSLGASGLEAASGLKQFFTARATLINENKRLQQNLVKLMPVEAERTRLATDNQALRKIFNYRPQNNSIIVTAAKILTRQNQSPMDVIIADVGRETVEHPLAVGDLAIGAGTVALGQVVAVTARTVKIELYSSWGSRLDVLVGADRIPAQATGRGSGNSVISLPRDLMVGVGDPIMVVRGENEYLLGAVKIVERDPSAAFQEIFFRSPLNLELLPWIEIYGT